MTTEHLHVRVEQHHIDAGTPRNACGCPVGLAIQSSGHYSDVRVHVSIIDTHIADLPNRSNIYQTWAIPPRARALIHAFDAGSPVNPCQFSLPLTIRHTTLY